MNAKKWGDAEMTLNEYYQRYELILKMPIGVIEKDKMLSSLMTDLERNFHIPMIKNESWQQEHLSVHTLYTKVSESRSL